MGRAVLACALALGLAIGGAAWAVDAAPPLPEGEAPTKGQYVVHVKMLRQNNDGTKTVLAEPSLIVPAGSPAYFLSGGYMPAGDGEVPFGTQARLTVSPAGKGKILVVGLVEHSEIAERGKGVVSRHADEAYIKQVLTLGKTSRTLLSSTPDASQWIELRVEAALAVERNPPVSE